MSVPKPTDTIERLMNAAEQRIRDKGYHAISFRDLADDLGIKSSSVHYYFRRKEDLAVALVERYSNNFFTRLEGLSATSASGPESGCEKLKAISSLYRAAYTANGQICLCGMLGAEKTGLPVEVSGAVASFLAKNIKWVADALPQDLPQSQRQARAEHIVASLQGALILAKNLSGIEVFDRVVDDLL